VRRAPLPASLAWFAAVVGGLTVGALATNGLGCSEGSLSGGAGGGHDTTSNVSGSGGDASVDVMPDGNPQPHKLNYADLCGPGCKPSDPTSCLPTGTGGSGGSGTSGVGGAASTSSGTGSSGSGSSGTSGSAGAGGAGSVGAGTPSELGCQISSRGAGPTSVCGPVGLSAFQGPCQTSSDCSAGFGCVATSSVMGGPTVSLCLAYCCGSLEDCETGTYCAPQPMAENLDRPIPVCTSVTPCELFTDECPTGQMCTVVRADGTTSCIPKGTGELCEACPCAPGYVCSATGSCQKLCHTTPMSECGSGSTCQGGSMNYPPGIGICVGGPSDCAP
jgi:hypothetical protein